MLAKTWWRTIVLPLMVMVILLVSCGDRAGSQTSFQTRNSVSAGNISEVSPPAAIQTLAQALERYQPQVKIVSPQPDEVLSDNTLKAQFQVQDLPIFKQPELNLGPHLNVILDNQPYLEIYDLSQPLVLTDLAPGTHTLRVFASRPWNESFKNEAAFAQVTFHVFTKTPENNPDTRQPLLTYNLPQGSYGAEPILLDFYLTNPPHDLANRDSNSAMVATGTRSMVVRKASRREAQTAPGIIDWQIRCTINGNSFIVDRWQPIYLKGFKPGKNWIQLELLDKQENTIKNVFNSTTRLITYKPNAEDTLSKLVRGELSAIQARGIVVTAIPSIPPVVEVPLPAETKPTPEVKSEPTLVEPTESEQPESNSLLNRLRRPNVTPSPTLPEIIEAPAPVIPETTLTPSPSMEE